MPTPNVAAPASSLFAWTRSSTRDRVELQAHHQRQEARFAVTEVPDDLVQAFHDISLACWRDLKEGIERSAGEQRGIRTELLDARQLVHRAARAYLVRDVKRSVQAELRREAVATTRSLLQDSAIRHKVEVHDSPVLLPTRQPEALVLPPSDGGSPATLQRRGVA
jgi:predicted ATP-dependent protease